ncbi:MAG: transcriptional regulator [Candidatus Thorarchaeota archaeon]
MVYAETTHGSDRPRHERESPGDLVEDLIVLPRRKRIIEMLEQAERPLNAREICDRLGLTDVNDVYADMHHISRTLKSEGRRLLLKPASCNKCGYLFKTRAVASKPARCPKCRSEWLSPPAFLIEK